jgi:AcrR family transcriptional regulator
MEHDALSQRRGAVAMREQPTELEKESVDLRRSELIATAASLFATKGYHAVSMRELAKQLSIKAGSLYYHIASKEQLLNEICTIGVRELVLNMDQAIRGHDAFTGRMRAIVSGHARLIDRFGDYLRCYQTEHVHLSPDIREHMRLELVRFHRKIEDVLKDAAAKGEIRAEINIKVARSAVIGILYQLSRTQSDRQYHDLIADGFSDILINGFVKR